MSSRPQSRALEPRYAPLIDALTAAGVELQSIAAHAEVSASTLRRVRAGQFVVRAVARSIELSVELLHTRHVRAEEPAAPDTPAPKGPSVCAPAPRSRAAPDASA